MHRFESARDADVFCVFKVYGGVSKVDFNGSYGFAQKLPEFVGRMCFTVGVQCICSLTPSAVD